MSKKLLLFSILFVLILSINAVSGYYFYPKYHTDDFRETTEFRQTTERKIGDFWNYESTKRTVIEKTDIRKRIRTPIYYPYYNYPSPNYYGNFYYGNSYTPFSSWRFKEPYAHKNYVNAHYSNY